MRHYLEPVPDHSTTGNRPDTVDEDWLQLILTKTAQACMETAGWTSGSTASDSSGAEMGRYETVKRDGLEKRRKKYAKYHVTAKTRKMYKDIRPAANVVS